MTSASSTPEAVKLPASGRVGRIVDAVRRSWRPVWTRDLLLLALVAVLYLGMFAITRRQELPQLLEATARNVLSLALAAIVVRPLIARALRAPLTVQLLAHLLLAAVFTVTWLWLLSVINGLLGAESVVRFSVNPLLSGLAVEWQLFQGLFVYGFLAALLALDIRPPAAPSLVVLEESSPEAARLLVRDGAGIKPLAAGRIVAIRGADDYAELVTLDGVRLVETRLAAFEAALDPSRFLRVHRSAIVNLDHLQRAEPVGDGRLLLHMAAGPPVPASRTGSRALRQRLL